MEQVVGLDLARIWPSSCLDVAGWAKDVAVGLPNRLVTAAVHTT
jgi:hypothetical protein